MSDRREKARPLAALDVVRPLLGVGEIVDLYRDRRLSRDAALQEIERTLYCGPPLHEDPALGERMLSDLVGVLASYPVERWPQIFAELFVRLKAEEIFDDGPLAVELPDERISRHAATKGPKS